MGPILLGSDALSFEGRTVCCIQLNLRPTPALSEARSTTIQHNLKSTDRLCRRYAEGFVAKNFVRASASARTRTRRCEVKKFDFDSIGSAKYFTNIRLQQKQKQKQKQT